MLGRLIDPLVRRWLQPPRWKAQPVAEAISRLGEDVTIPADMLPLSAWLLRPAGRPIGSVTFVHGWGHEGGRMAGLAAQVVARRMAALLVDLPGHGRTGPVGNYNAKLMVDDLRRVRDWIAAREELRLIPAAIVGFSFGGLGAYVAASRDARWAALAVLAAPLGAMAAARLYLDGQGLPGRWLEGIVRRSFIRTVGVDPAEFDAARNLGAIRVPVLIVHGEKDEVVPAWHADKLAAAAPSGLATMVRVPGAGHSDVLVDDGVGARVAEFLRVSLSQGGGPS